MTQTGILAPVPAHARFMYFDLKQPEVAAAALMKLNERNWTEDVIGLGADLLTHLGADIPELACFPQFEQAKVEIPITQRSLLVILRGQDAGDLIVRGGLIQASLSPAFALRDCENAFKYQNSRDLTGYIDGTENPEERAAEVALISSGTKGVDGGSIVVVQTFEHDLGRFQSLEQSQKDDVIGRRLSDNEEFDEAPETAHVKRAAQESFDPEAFLLRRSMPYQRGPESGLVFVAYATSLQPYTMILRRMVGAEDGKVDQLFTFTTPKTGGVYFCPPVEQERLDLSAVLGS